MDRAQLIKPTIGLQENYIPTDGLSMGEEKAIANKLPRGEATRAHLVEAARGLFVANGYEATSIEAVLSCSGVSRGALYHHFESKMALFTAVLEAVEARVAQVIVDASRGIPDPIAALHAGCDAWLELGRDPVVKQIVLTDAPVALGWQKWRAIDARFGFGLLKASLKNAAQAGVIETESVDVLAHIMLAALLEAALLIARADDDAAMLRSCRAAVREMIDGFLGGRAGKVCA